MDNTGRKVKVHYIGTFDDGFKFDSSYDNGEPIEFICMDGAVIEGLDMAIRDMEVGETKNIHVPADLAYGDYDPEAKQKLPVAMFPNNGKDLPIGKHLYTQDGQGGFMPVLIVGVDDYEVTVDVNHPMAGKDLNFEVTLVASDEIPALEFPEYAVPGESLAEAKKKAGIE